MNLFQKTFQDITFDDVVDFCKKYHPESTTLDYKQAIPKDLAKHFATFSNTLGGVIIIGVEEDSKTGLPLKWDGLTNDGKLLERVNQFAANVDPLPTFNTRVTEEKNNKLFLLINILEGDAPPYLPNGDPTVWLRTGNISNPLQQPNREELQRMIEKKKFAETARTQNIKNADEMFLAGLDRAETYRKKAMEQAEKAGKPHTLATKPYDEDNTFLRFSIQPYYPKRILVDPREIKNKLGDLQTRNRFGSDFPPMDMEPIPNGLFSLKQTFTGDQIRGYQLYGNGLIHYTEDIWWITDYGKKSIYLSHVAGAVYKQLVFARKFYSTFGYSGLLVGEITLQNALGANVRIVIPDGYTDLFPERYQIEKLSDYSWDIETDTYILSDKGMTDQLFKKILQKVYWSLGVEMFQDDVIDKFLEQSGWK